MEPKDGPTMLKQASRIFGTMGVHNRYQMYVPINPNPALLIYFNYLLLFIFSTLRRVPRAIHHVNIYVKIMHENNSLLIMF